MLWTWYIAYCLQLQAAFNISADCSKFLGASWHVFRGAHRVTICVCRFFGVISVYPQTMGTLKTWDAPHWSQQF